MFPDARIPTKLLRSFLIAACFLATIAIAMPRATWADTCNSESWSDTDHNGSWQDDNNWSSQMQPKACDSVTISSDHTVHMTDVPAISLTNFSYTPSTVPFSMSGAPVTVTGTFDWNGGTLGMNVTATNASIDGGLSGGTKELNADLSVSGDLGMADNDVDKPLRIDDPHTLTIGSAGTFTAAGHNQITFLACCVTPAKVINNGTINVTGDLLNGGQLNIDGVELDQNKTFEGDDGSSLNLTGPLVVPDGAAFNGSGATFNIENHGTTTTVNGTQTIGNGATVQFSNGQIGGTSTLSGPGTFRWTGGTLADQLTIAHGASVIATGFQTVGSGNRQTILNTNPNDSTNHTGSIDNHGLFSVEDGAFVSTQPASVTTVESDGVLNMRPGTSLDGSGSCCVNPGAVINHGTVQATLAPGTPTTGIFLPATINGARYSSDSSSTTSVGPNQFLELTNLTGPAQSSIDGGTVTGGGTFRIAGLATLAHSTTVSKPTTLEIAKGALTSGTSTFGGDGNVSWTGGEVNGALTVASTGGFTVGGSDAKNVGNFGTPATLTTTSPTTFQGPTTVTVFAGNALTTNGKTTVQHDVTVTSPSCCNNVAQFVNDTKGAITFDPGSGKSDTISNVAFENLGASTIKSGTLNATFAYDQHSGDTEVTNGATLSAGTCCGASPITVSGGRLVGEGTISNGLLNSGGTIDPGTTKSGSVGQLTVNGTMRQQPGGRLELDIAKKRKHDSLVVNGTAYLAGVEHSFVAKKYKPKKRTKIGVLTATSVEGAFDCSFTNGHGRFVPQESPTAVTLAFAKGTTSGCLVYHPTAPQRVASAGTVVSAGHDVDVLIAGHAGVPKSGASAVTVNVLTNGASDAGALTVTRGLVAPSGSAQTQEYSPSAPSAALDTVALNGGKIRLHATNGSVTVFLDVEGYSTDGENTTGALFHPIALPSSFTEPGTVTVDPGNDVDLAVNDKGGVPHSGASAVTARVTVVNPSGDGTLSVWPGGTTAPTETIAFTAGHTVSNVVALALPSDQALRLHTTGSSADVAVQILGYYTNDGTGSWLKLVAPTRILSNDVDSCCAVNQHILGGVLPASGGTSYLLSSEVTNPTADTALSLGHFGIGGNVVTEWEEVPSGGDLSMPVVLALPVPAAPGDNPYLTEELSAGSATVSIDALGYTVG